MNIEIPVLRLGTAGFTDPQQRTAADAARAASTSRAHWAMVPFAEADGWWLEGGRTHVLPSGFLRVQPGVPSGRSVQIAMTDVDRPVGFSLPLAAPGFQPAVTFNLEDRERSVAVLHQFAGWLQPMLAQFGLAASLSASQPTLGAGSWEVLRGPHLIAVVDLRLGAAVAPTATPADFEAAVWSIRDHGDVSIPADFIRSSVGQLMWQYALRTERDLLPSHYRHQLLYFRRPPRLPQRQLKDAHLLLLRELAAEPMNFEQLQQATGLGEGALARNLSALYVVGAITANPRRAANGGGVGNGAGRPGNADSVSGSNTFGSVMDSVLAPAPQRRPM
ncbi:MAG TPA: hypothetical protein VIL30_16910, partial [Ramlibacter sp.]